MKTCNLWSANSKYSLVRLHICADWPVALYWWQWQITFGCSRKCRVKNFISNPCECYSSRSVIENLLLENMIARYRNDSILEETTSSLTFKGNQKADNKIKYGVAEYQSSKSLVVKTIYSSTRNF